MKVKQVEGALRNASPTTRERFREALADYQGILSARIASVKEMATKEEVLRGRCGFQSKVVARPEKGAHKAGARGTPNSTTETVPTITPPPAHRLAMHAPHVSKRSIVSALYMPPGGQRRPEPSPSRDTSSPAPSSPLSVRPQPQHSTPTHPTPTYQPPVPHATTAHSEELPLSPLRHQREEETTAAYSCAQRELSQLFRQERGLQRRRTSTALATSFTEHNGIDAPEPLAESVGRDQPPRHTNGHYDDVRHQLNEARERNAILRANVQRVLQRTLSPEAQHVGTEALPPQCSTPPPCCFCVDCTDFAECLVERALHRTFALVRRDLDSVVGGTAVADQLVAAEEESLLVRMRRVELLASRMHWQRLGYVAHAARPLLDGFSAAGLTHLDGLAAAGACATATTSSTTALDALEVLHDLASAHGSLRRYETATLHRIAELRRSHGVLCALSMLSELLWCVEETT